MKSLKPRLLTAAIGIPAVILIIVFSELWNPFLSIILGAASAIMVGEYLYGRRIISVLPLSLPCMLFAMLLPFFIVAPNALLIMLFILFLLVFISMIAMHRRLRFSDAAYALTGTALISIGMSSVAHCCSGGISVTFYFVLIFLLPWMADAGGYFIGANFGKRRLAPEISPKKTVEGVIGGIMFCLISAVAMGLIFQLIVLPDVSINFFSLIIIALLDAVLSVVGDLSFSLIKRSLGIKDYGSVFPGHGGFLDRCDSIIFTAPAVLAVNVFLPVLTV